jgi:hypothetical protein
MRLLDIQQLSDEGSAQRETVSWAGEGGGLTPHSSTAARRQHRLLLATHSLLDQLLLTTTGNTAKSDKYLVFPLFMPSGWKGQVGGVVI